MITPPSRRAQVDDTVVTWQRPEHPHNSAEFAAHTGLTHYYPKYMVGGGYIVSADVARMIVVTHQLVCQRRQRVMWPGCWQLHQGNLSGDALGETG